MNSTINEFNFFLRVFAWSEMQTDSSRIWTWITDSISYANNCHAKYIYLLWVKSRTELVLWLLGKTCLGEGETDFKTWVGAVFILCPTNVRIWYKTWVGATPSVKIYFLWKLQQHHLSCVTVAEYSTIWLQDQQKQHVFIKI